MRVAVVIDRWAPSRGGAERATADFARHLAASGDEVLVYAMSAEHGAPGEFRRMPRPARPRGPQERAFARAAVRAARADRCDAVVAIRHAEDCDAYWPHGGLHAATLAAGEASKGPLRVVSRALHGASVKHRAFLSMERRALEGGARVVWCVSDLVRREIVAAHPACAARIEVHPNGVDTDAFSPHVRAERRAGVRSRLRLPDAPVLVFAGTPLRLKGWPVLLRALPRVEGRWHLLAVGPTRVPAPLRSRVTLAPRQDPRDLWAAADLLVQPTWRDPCPLATLEAAACGVPCVTTSANGACASGVPPGDADAFAAAVSRALASPPRPAAVRSRGDWLAGLRASLATS
ncbi:MAG: D-inositol-3-phosphate glycosyltransferase [Planctomycetes bacterium]|nr:D-inositol-3-phosphate glycosyltransferase [Planctomycetota bacterium]